MPKTLAHCIMIIVIKIKHGAFSWMSWRSLVLMKSFLIWFTNAYPQLTLLGSKYLETNVLEL